MINFKKVVSMVVMLSLMLSACGKSPARRDDNNANTNMESPKDESIAKANTSAKDNSPSEPGTRAGVGEKVALTAVVIAGLVVAVLWWTSKKKTKPGGGGGGGGGAAVAVRAGIGAGTAGTGREGSATDPALETPWDLRVRRMTPNQILAYEYFLNPNPDAEEPPIVLRNPQGTGGGGGEGEE